MTQLRALADAAQMVLNRGASVEDAAYAMGVPCYQLEEYLDDMERADREKATKQDEEIREAAENLSEEASIGRALDKAFKGVEFKFLTHPGEDEL